MSRELFKFILIQKVFILNNHKQSMPKVLEFKDKKGRVILLPRERWSHIQKDHPEVRIEEIELTIKTPTKIIPSDRDPEVRWLYRYNKSEKNYLMVAIKYLKGKGFIITAYYVDKIK